jgi:hypothetical protein
MSRNPLRDIVQENLRSKVNQPNICYGTLGNAAGVVDIPGPYGWVWVTMTDGSEQKAYDVNTPHKLGYPVKCGYDPYIKNGLLKVLDTWDMPQSVSTASSNNPVAPHHASHEWLNSNGGGDVVYVRMRQFMPLRPTVIAPFGIYIEPDLQNINGVWQSVGGSTIDLSGYVPAYASGSIIQECFVLITINSASGSIVATSGSVAAAGSLTMNMVPTYASTEYPICIVHLYSCQTQITEALVPGTDLADVRWGMFKNSSKVDIKIDSVYIGSAKTVNLISGTNITLSGSVVSDGQVNITVNAGGSGSSGSSVYPQRATMWHDEANVTVGNDLVQPGYQVNQNYVVQPYQVPPAS